MKRFFAFLSRLAKKLSGTMTVAEKWAEVVGWDTIIKTIESTQQNHPEWATAVRRQWVVNTVKDTLQRRGYTVPTSVLNFLIEAGYQIWLAKTGETPTEPKRQQ